MTTAPFAADSGLVVAQTHRQDFAVRATHPDWAEPLTLDASRCQVSWDESRAPRVRAALSVRVPDDQETLDSLDPRLGVRLEVDAGYVRPGGVRDVHTLADLGLRVRGVVRPGDTLELDAASDEALVIDDAPSQGYSLTSPTRSGAVTQVLNAVFDPNPTVVVTTSDATATTLDGITDKWSAVQDLADQMGARVYDAGLRTWYVEPVPDLAGEAAHSLVVGAGGTVVGSVTGLSRESDWYNRVFLRYRWRDTLGDEHVVESVRSVTSGDFAAGGPAGVRTYFAERAVPTTQASADAAADAIVRRFVSRGRSFRLRAVAAYWLRPGHTVDVRLPLGPTERHLVSSVTFDLTAGWMDLTTRLPQTVTTGA